MVSRRMPDPLRGAFIAVVAAAIGTGGTLAGSAIATANASHNLTTQIRHEDQIRQADLRRDAYAKFVSVAIRYIIDIQTNVSDQSTARADLHDVVAAYSEIQLVGSPEAAQLAVKIGQELIDITNKFYNGKVYQDGASSRAGAAADMVRDDFVPVARTDVNRIPS